MKKLLTHGSLFSGVGGFDLAASWAGIPTLWEVEKDEYCRAVLAKHFPEAKQYDDIKGLTELESVDIISGGFPCQSFSVAGKRRGTADDRWLWPEMFRVIREIKPSWVIAENVRGLISIEQGMVFESVLADLEAIGYEVQAFVIPACAVNAPHRRDRIWIVANAIGGGRRTAGESGSVQGVFGRRTNDTMPTQESSDVPYANTAGLGERRRPEPIQQEQHSAQCVGENASHSAINGLETGWTTPRIESTRPYKRDWWAAEPDVGRVAHGVSRRVDRLRSLGNAIVPAIAFQLFQAIQKVEKEESKGEVMEELKPCPWCGVIPNGVKYWRQGHEQGEQVDTFSIGCNPYGSCLTHPFTGWLLTEKEAIAAWNRRANEK